MSSGTKSRPLEVFWTSDDASSTSSAFAFIPGISDIGSERPHHNQRKTALSLKTKDHSSDTSLNNNTKILAKNTNSTGVKRADGQNGIGKHERKISLKDLCSEDKKRVANLIKELAKTGLEKESALEQLQKERVIFEQQVKNLKEQQEKIVNERKLVQEQYKECQELLVSYQRQIVEQQEKLSSSIQELTSPKQKSEESEKMHQGPQPRAELYTPQKELDHQAGDSRGVDDMAVDQTVRYGRENYDAETIPRLNKSVRLENNQRGDYGHPPQWYIGYGSERPHQLREGYGTPPERRRVQWVGYDVPPQYNGNTGYKPEDRRRDQEHGYGDVYFDETPSRPYTKRIDRTIKQQSYDYQDRKPPHDIYNSYNGNVLQAQPGYDTHSSYRAQVEQDAQNRYGRDQQRYEPFRDRAQYFADDLLPEPVMTSTQASQQIGGRNVNPHRASFSAHNSLGPERFKNISAILKSPPEKDRRRGRLPNKVRWVDRDNKGILRSGVESPVSTNFHDHVEAAQQASPEQRKVALLQQRAYLMQEQARLRAILREQEVKLQTKQDQLQEQHRLQRARLWHFEKTGRFPEQGDEDDGLQDPQLSSVDNMILDGTLDGDDMLKANDTQFSQKLLQPSVHESIQGSLPHLPPRLGQVSRDRLSEFQAHEATFHEVLPYVPPKNNNVFHYSILKEATASRERDDGTPVSETDENLEFLARRGVNVASLSPVRVKEKRRKQLATRSMISSCHDTSGVSSLRVDASTSPLRDPVLKQGNRQLTKEQSFGRSSRQQNVADIVDSVERSQYNEVATSSDLFDEEEETEESQVLEEIFFLK